MSSRETASSCAVNRRRFLGGVGAAAVVGTAATALPVSPAGADGGGKTFPPRPAPKPIEFAIELPPSVPPPFNVINVALPGPDGATTPILELLSDGPDADPSTVGDFDGFTAFAVIAGTATGGDGEPYDCEFDIRVMQGRYVAEDGHEYRGTFAFL